MQRDTVIHTAFTIKKFTLEVYKLLKRQHNECLDFSVQAHPQQNHPTTADTLFCEAKVSFALAWAPLHFHGSECTVPAFVCKEQV